jgi:hypothetical protein
MSRLHENIPGAIYQKMVPHRTSIIKWRLTCMNVFLIVGFGVEAQVMATAIA